MNKNDPYVSATEVAEAFYCCYRLQNKLNKLSVSKRALRNAERGNKKHEYQNRVGRDRRCFVATYAYGADDYRTKQLRVFRDQVMANSFLGRLLILIYYIISPQLVSVARRFPLIDRILKKCLHFISSWL